MVTNHDSHVTNPWIESTMVSHGKAARERHQAHVQEALNREKEARVLSSKRFVGLCWCWSVLDYV